MDDDAIMGRALAAARESLERGDFPVGAALCIDGEVVAVAGNVVTSTRTLVAHAEARLLVEHGPALVSAWERESKRTAIYTTLQPCLMCLSACAHSRIARVVYACRDPLAGTDPGALPEPSGFYRVAWPRLEHCQDRERDSAEIMLEFSRRRPGWDRLRDALLGVLETPR